MERLALIAEVETLIKVGRHPNIVSLVGACTFEGMTELQNLRELILHIESYGQSHLKRGNNLTGNVRLVNCSLSV